MLCRFLPNSGLSKHRHAAYKPPQVEPDSTEVLQAIRMIFDNQNSTLMQTVKDSEKDSKGQKFQQLDECCKNMFQKMKGDYFNIYCYIVEDEQKVPSPQPKIKVKKEKNEEAPARRGSAASSTPKQENTLNPHDLQEQINFLQSQLFKIQRNSLGMQLELEPDDFSLLQPLQEIAPK
ncbi:hypothetical protein TKK_0000432 [Trichogramma kaykai]